MSLRTEDLVKVGESFLFRKVRKQKIPFYFDCVDPGDSFVDLATIKNIVKDVKLTEPFIPQRYTGRLSLVHRPTPYPCILVTIEQNRNTVRVYDAGTKTTDVVNDLDLPDDMTCVFLKSISTTPCTLTPNTLDDLTFNKVKSYLRDGSSLPDMTSNDLTIAVVVKKAEKYAFVRNSSMHYANGRGRHVGPHFILIPHSTDYDEMAASVVEFLSRYTLNPLTADNLRWLYCADENPASRVSNQGTCTITMPSGNGVREGAGSFEYMPGTLDSNFIDIIGEHVEAVSMMETQEFDYEQYFNKFLRNSFGDSKYKLRIDRETCQFVLSAYIEGDSARTAHMARFAFCSNRPDLIPIAPKSMYDMEEKTICSISRELFSRKLTQEKLSSLINAMSNNEKHYHIVPDELYKESVAESLEVVNTTDWLYEFQKETVRDMICHETCPDGTASLYGTRASGTSFSSGVFTTREENSCKYIPPELAGDLKRTMGILADEPGMGKTRQCAALVKATANRATSATLIIVQPTVFNQWKDEILAVWPEVDLYTYYGRWKNNERLNEAFVNSDIVLTTASTLTSNIGQFAYRTWFRLVVDESHAIPNSLARGIQIGYRHKWGVTGTPDINLMKQITWLFQDNLWMSFDRAAWNFDKSNFLLPWFVWRLLRPILFRKTRSLHLNLPEVHEHTVNIELSQREMSRYNEVARSVRARHPNGVYSVTTATSCYNMLQGAATMGDAVDDALNMSRAPGDALNVFSETQFLDLAQVPLDEICPICIDAFEDVCRTACNHYFCTECLSLHVDRSSQCPLCRGAITGHSVLKCPPEVDDAMETQVAREESSKAIKVSDDIREILGADPDSKILVFFQQAYMLTWFKSVLENRVGVNCLTVSGRDSVAKRSKNFSLFQNSQGAGHRVMLMTTRCASAGITLTEADHVMVITPCMQQALEQQLIGRANRIGRGDRPVHFYRYISQGTVEELVVNRFASGSGDSMHAYAVNTTIERQYD